MRPAVCLAALAACLPAQQLLKFEVASVKMRRPGAPVSMVGGAPSGARLTLEAMSLSDLIAWAYNSKIWQVSGGLPWAGVQQDRTALDLAAQRFDIVAKAEGDQARSPEEFRQMMQALLAERFGLALHREQREVPVYALVKDKNGPKFRQSAADAKGILRMNGGGRITASGSTMTQLVGWFSNANGVDRPVADETGLTGRYDFTLEWSNPLAGAPESTAPSVFTAFSEQLGLKLEPRRAPVEFIVIDRAALPGEN
jgi:uncharacterized protein (TIGR03435 family)